MSTVIHVALVPRGIEMDPTEISSVAAALSIQIARDFGPIWDITATVASFPNPQVVPVGYWPIYILDPSKLPPDEGGVHLDRHNQPYALIKAGDQWSLDASHECLEMLVDPSGNKVQANPLLDQAVALGQQPHQVQYVVEVCDPIEDAQYGYPINGVLVSDFITPHFYDPVKATGVRYDFTGAIDGPRQVKTNGYISWLDPLSGDAMQLLNFLGQDGQLHPQIVDLSQQARFQEVARAEGLRPAIDRVTRAPDYRATLTNEQRSSLAQKHTSVRQAAEARAKYLHEDIEQVLARRG